MKDPARWPPQLREELGKRFRRRGSGARARSHRRHFPRARRALDDFKPDVIMFGDDQYENFKEDIVSAFAVLAYDSTSRAVEEPGLNPWGEPNDARFSYEATVPPANTWHRGSSITASTGHAYRPLHHPRGHALCLQRYCCWTTSASGSTIPWCRSR